MYRWERRAQREESKRSRMKVSGRGMSQIYKNSALKKLNVRMSRKRKAEERDVS